MAGSAERSSTGDGGPEGGAGVPIIALRGGVTMGGSDPLDQPRLLWESRLLYYRKHRPHHEAVLLAGMVRAAYRLRALAWGLRGRFAPVSQRDGWRARAESARALVQAL